MSVFRVCTCAVAPVTAPPLHTPPPPGEVRQTVALLYELNLQPRDVPHLLPKVQPSFYKSKVLREFTHMWPKAADLLRDSRRAGVGGGLVSGVCGGGLRKVMKKRANFSRGKLKKAPGSQSYRGEESRVRDEEMEQ